MQYPNAQQNYSYNQKYALALNNPQMVDKPVKIDQFNLENILLHSLDYRLSPMSEY